MKYEAILFDMDGVILDSEPIHIAAFQQALNDRGLTLSEDDYKEYFAGKTDEQGFKDYFEAIDEQIDVAEIMAAKANIFLDITPDKLVVYPGIIELIQTLANQVPLALVTSSLRSETDSALKSLTIDDCFDIIVTADDIDEGKPSPEGYLQAASLLSKQPETCVVIEDSPSGVTAAKAANMTCIAVTNTHTERELTHADLVVNTLTLELFYLS